MKLCKDCKHYRGMSFWEILFTNGVNLTVCAHPDLVSKVDGTAREFCDVQRSFSLTECGKDGRLFEAK